MRPSVRVLVSLAIVLPGCVQPSEGDDVADGGLPLDEGGEDGAMASPCDEYAAGENPGGEEACFTWVEIRCAAEAEPASCEAAVGVESPGGDLGCVWSDSAALAEEDACHELDGAERCVAAVRVDPACEGTAHWSRFDEDTGGQRVIELDCALMPVPEFESCDETTNACC
jgi:hypothetical protein